MALSSDLTFMTAAESKSQILEDLELQALDAGITNPPIEPGGEWNLIATGIANAGSVLLANQEILDEDSDPLRATGAALDEWRQRLQLPEVASSPAAGQLTITVVGTGAIPAGLGFQAPNGFVGTVTSGATSATGATTVDAQMTTTGPDGNLVAGTRVRLVGGPPNLQTEAVVTTDWTGGTLAEDDTRKRERVLNRLQNSGSGWNDLRDKILESTGAISDGFIYWALGGPGSVKGVVVSNTSTRTRQVGAATVADVQDYVDAAFPDGTWNLVIQSALDNPTNIAIGLKLPATGRHKWLAGGPTGVAYVSGTSYVSQTAFRITGTLGNLSVGDTIACWDATNQTAATARVLTLSSSDVTTTPWSGGAGPVAATRIFAACDQLDDVISAWLAIMLKLTPGENLPSTDPRFPFAARLPIASSERPMSLSNTQLLQLQGAVPEATDASYLELSSSTTAPVLASDAPLVVTLNKFGIYPI